MKKRYLTYVAIGLLATLTFSSCDSVNRSLSALGDMLSMGGVETDTCDDESKETAETQWETGAVLWGETQEDMEADTSELCTEDAEDHVFETGKDNTADTAADDATETIRDTSVDTFEGDSAHVAEDTVSDIPETDSVETTMSGDVGDDAEAPSADTSADHSGNVAEETWVSDATDTTPETLANGFAEAPSETAEDISAGDSVDTAQNDATEPWDETVAEAATEESPETNDTSSGEVDTAIPENMPWTVVCLSGTPDAYTYDGTTLTFTTVSEESSYAIRGEMAGNIVIDTGDSYKFTLEMRGFTLRCDDTNPVTVLSGDEVTLKAKSGYENVIYDDRAAIDPADTTLYSAAVYAMVDLELSGRGSLAVTSENNHGIHTKDDLQVKSLTLSVTCVDDALKGNDSVEITDATTTLIATGGDCIKTTNSHVNASTGVQKGIVYIAGGTHKLYATCDGIDAAYNVEIADGITATVLDIYTDKYSTYSGEVTDTSSTNYYIRFNKTTYQYSVLYSNSTTGESQWVNVGSDYETISSSGNRPGQSSTYYYYTFSKLSGYDKLTVYMYTSSQSQGQASDYYACSSLLSVNESYDTLALSYRNSALSVSWTNYGTTSTGGMGGMGGMQEGNTDKGIYSTKGIKACNEITINGGTINIKSYDDAIHANNDGGTLQNGASPLGNVTINGGIITAYSNDDGLHADGTMAITDGSVSITNAYEGIEGKYIVISGGDVYVKSTDDGFNGTSTSGAAITVSGGRVFVHAGGDGIDSNSTTSKGAIVFSGGDVVVISTSNGNSCIDSDGGYTHSGGRVLALMPTGGMTSETTNGNTTGRTTKSSLSLTNGGYVTVTVGGSTVVTVQMPTSLSAYAIYLGSSSAIIASATSTSAVLDIHGICWAE